MKILKIENGIEPIEGEFNVLVSEAIGVFTGH